MHAVNLSRIALSKVALFSLATVALLSGCGFQPVQPLTVDEARLPIFISPIESLDRALMRQLSQQQMSTHRKTTARSTIEFKNVSFSERDFSVSSDGRNAEYEIVLEATVVWQRVKPNTSSTSSNSGATHPKTLYLKSPLRAETTFLSNPLNPSAEAAERNRIRQLLEEQLVEQTLELMSIATNEQQQ